jgi:hypothetical protein
VTFPEQQPSMGAAPQPPLQVVPAVQVAAVQPVPQAQAEPSVADESVVVRLTTADGEADIRVPPMKGWRSTARSALFTRGDDLFWAVNVLSAEDAQKWADLDPRQDESDRFFKEWGRLTGMQGNRADRRSRH